MLVVLPDGYHCHGVYMAADAEDVGPTRLRWGLLPRMPLW